ncbi:Heterokaryon incompatibility protein S [Lasiodiplodia theobromae]|uniref:Heterokaryon incompatibility protein S n=1 Tax=Lasiodiplodia theobromae TaxID=45133 RepID=A0A5N5D8X5_9PEZI|nr:Heterokaryon incompatibility protein S [Lasiodiplodia theobromae]
MEFATGTVNLFNVALDFFERIQLARDFQKDFAIHQIKLDIIQLRLSRWGEVTAINRQGQNAQTTSNCPDLDWQAAGILEQIRDTYEKAQEDANSMRPGSNALEEAPLDPETHINDRLKRLRTKLRHCLRKSTSDAAQLGHRIKWAFYKKSHFEGFVEDISALLDALEQLLPEDARKQLQELSKAECEDLGKPALETLRDVVEDCDPWMKLAVSEELSKGSYAGVKFVNKGTNYGQQSTIHNGSVEINGASYGRQNRIVNNWAKAVRQGGDRRLHPAGLPISN